MKVGRLKANKKLLSTVFILMWCSRFVMCQVIGESSNVLKYKKKYKNYISSNGTHLFIHFLYPLSPTLRIKGFCWGQSQLPLSEGRAEIVLVISLKCKSR